MAGRHALADPKAPTVGDVVGSEALDAAVRTRLLQHLDVRVDGEHLETHPADPVAAKADLAVRKAREVRAERAAEGLEHLFRGLERDAADQVQRAFHCVILMLRSLTSRA